MHIKQTFLTCFFYICFVPWRMGMVGTGWGGPQHRIGLGLGSLLEEVVGVGAVKRGRGSSGRKKAG